MTDQIQTVLARDYMLEDGVTYFGPPLVDTITTDAWPKYVRVYLNKSQPQLDLYKPNRGHNK